MLTAPQHVPRKRGRGSQPLFRHEAHGGGHGGHGVAAGLGQAHEGVEGLGDAELGAGHEDGLAGPVEEGGGGVDGDFEAELYAELRRWGATGPAGCR